MELIRPTYKLESVPTNLLQLERYARVCYKSENKTAPGTADSLIKRVIARGHESVLEHESLTVRFVCDRGVTHELVRHRLCAFSQESTRYCSYAGGVAFVIPPWLPGLLPGTYIGPREFEDTACSEWFNAMRDCEYSYVELLGLGWTPQQARSVLPNALKTEIVCTANLREWRHILKLRTAKAAHPQMQELMQPLCRELAERLPVVFEGIYNA